MELELFLIRHGESEANIKPHLIGGRSEEADLTHKGRLQAKLLGARLKRENLCFDAVYCSTAERVLSTCAESLSGFYPLDQVIETDQLVEMSQGEWEGEERSKIHTDPILVEMNTKGKFYIPANGTGESQRMVERRVSNWLEDEVLYNQKYQTGKNRLAIFAHGQVFRNLLHYVMGFNDRLIHRIKIDNTSITKLYFDQNGWGIGPEFNDTSHLNVQNDTRFKFDPDSGSGIVRTRGYARGSNSEKWLRECYLDSLDKEQTEIKGGV